MAEESYSDADYALADKMLKNPEVAIKPGETRSYADILAAAKNMNDLEKGN